MIPWSPHLHWNEFLRRIVSQGLSSFHEIVYLSMRNDFALSFPRPSVMRTSGDFDCMFRWGSLAWLLHRIVQSLLFIHRVDDVVLCTEMGLPLRMVLRFDQISLAHSAANWLRPNAMPACLNFVCWLKQSCFLLIELINGLLAVVEACNRGEHLLIW